MEIKLCLGGIRFLFTSKRPIRVGKEFTPFLDGSEADKSVAEKPKTEELQIEEPQTEGSQKEELYTEGSETGETEMAEPDTAPDLTVPFLWEWSDGCTATTPMLGKDLQQHYYAEDDLRFCQTWGGPKGYIASTVYTPDFRTLKCYVNQEPFINPLNDLRTLIRYLPMREIFQHFGVIFFHAAQVEMDGKGVLFTAPSGTGKTTQARLWQKLRGAELVCNDRTLVRKTGDQWKTYGYPVDGSAPVRSGSVLPLGAVVLLQQAPVNEVVHLPGAQAVAHLMEQMVMDVWSVEARTRAAALAVELLREVPVCLLRCRPDSGAVECLEQWMKEKGVF